MYIATSYQNQFILSWLKNDEMFSLLWAYVGMLVRAVNGVSAIVLVCVSILLVNQTCFLSLICMKLGKRLFIFN